VSVLTSFSGKPGICGCPLSISRRESASCPISPPIMLPDMSLLVSMPDRATRQVSERKSVCRLEAHGTMEACEVRSHSPVPWTFPAISGASEWIRPGPTPAKNFPGRFYSGDSKSDSGAPAVPSGSSKGFVQLPRCFEIAQHSSDVEAASTTLSAQNRARKRRLRAQITDTKLECELRGGNGGIRSGQCLANGHTA
jgi:hypothetical protein